MVTSSAVVGSSAISSAGAQASAMAIITRWRMPPESLCGYSSTRMLRRGDAARAPACRWRRARAAAADRPRWRISASPIWSPTVKLGLSEVIGSWKIMARRLPRRSCICRSGSAASSRPSKTTEPDTRVPAFGSSRMMDSAVTLLPQPDSPTMPSVRPAIEREADAAHGLRDAAAVALEDDAQVARPSSSGAALTRSPPRSTCAISSSSSLRSVSPEGLRAARHLAAEVHPALARHLLQPRQLGQRIGVIVDAQVVERDSPRSSWISSAADCLPRLSPPAASPACIAAISRRANGSWPFGSRRRGSVSARTAGPASMLPATEKVGAHLVPAPVDAGGTGVGGEPALAIHDVQLAVVRAPRRRRCSRRNRLVGARARPRAAPGPAARSAG